MLKTLSLLPEGARDVADEDNDNSESRMLRALQALSHPQNQPVQPNQPQPALRDEAVFRPNRTMRDMARDQQRDQSALHQARGRHRFVKDGEVPVVHMAVTRPAPAAPRLDGEHMRLQQALDEQRLRAEAAERTKAEIQLQLKTLQTKFAHAEMAANDSAALAEARLQEITALQDQLRLLAAAPPPAPPPPVPAPVLARPERRDPSPSLETLFPMPPRAEPVRKPRTRAVPPPEPVAVLEDEPEPVQWWLAPAKTTAKRPRR